MMHVAALWFSAVPLAKAETTSLPVNRIGELAGRRYTPMPPAMADQTPSYHAVDALANTANTTLQTTAVGAVVAGVQNTLRKQNVGAMGIITRSGGVIALYGAWGEHTIGP